MSNNFISRIRTNLDGVLQTTSMFDGIMMMGDDNANQIIVELYRGHTAYSIPAGTKIVGYFIRSDGATLEVDGEVTEEGYASITIPAIAYQVSGNLSIAVRMFLDPSEENQRGYYKTTIGEFVRVTDDTITEGPNGEDIIIREVTENETRRGYYTEDPEAFIIVDDENQTEGPNGENIIEITIPHTTEERGYYAINTSEFVLVTDPSITEGPNGEEILQRTVTVYANKVGIASASCFVQLTETGTIIEPGHIIPDINDIMAKLSELDLTNNALIALEGQVSSAEASRVNVEAARVTSESARASAESARALNEQTRITNEASRANAESSRVSAENARIQAENARATAETARAQAETARQNAIQNMSIGATHLSYDATPTATISDVNGHKHIQLGLVPGKPFAIKKSFTSVAQMQSYTGSDVAVNEFVIITSTVEDPDNAKLYMKLATGWFFITDLSGATGIQGPKGDTGNGIVNMVMNADFTLTFTYDNGEIYTTPTSIRGVQGPKGDTGVSISNAVLNNDYTLTITFTDGTSWTSPNPIRGPQGVKGDPGEGRAEFTYESGTLNVTFG